TILDPGTGTAYGTSGSDPSVGQSRAQLCPGVTHDQLGTSGNIKQRLGGASGGPGYLNASAFCAAPAVPFGVPDFFGGLPTQFGVQNYTYTFKVDGSKLTGRVKSQFSDGEILEGTITGDDISFVENLTYEGMPLRIVYKGKISGDEIRLSRNVADIATEEAV